MVREIDIRPPSGALRRHSGSTVVGLDDYQVLADIGILPHEIGRRRKLVVSISLDVEAPESDSIEKTVDYASLPALVEQLAARRFGLIECFAQALARGYLVLPRVLAATVRVAKPDALPNGIPWTSVRLEKKSDNVPS